VRGSGSRATGGVPAGMPAAAAKATDGGTRMPRRRWSPGRARSGERGTGGCCRDRLFGPECNSPRRDRGGRRRGGARERAGGRWAARAVRVLIDEATGNPALPRRRCPPVTPATTACHAGASCRGGLSSDGGGGRRGR
jgi:hypothetical protein